MKALSITVSLRLLRYLSVAALCVMVAGTAWGQAEKAELKKPEDAFDGVPAETVKKLKLGDAEMESAMKTANPVVTKNVQGKTGTFPITVSSVSFEEGSYRIRAQGDTFKMGRNDIWLFITVFSPGPQSPKMDRLKPGDKIRVTGDLDGNLYALKGNKQVGVGLALRINKAQVR